MICQDCGKELNDDFKMCPYCGCYVIRNEYANQQQFRTTQQMPQCNIYEFQPFQDTPPKNNNATLGIIALILGIAGVLLSCIYIGIIPAIAAIIIGIIGITKNSGFGMSIAGIACGVAGIIVFSILFSEDDSISTSTQSNQYHVETESETISGEKSSYKSSKERFIDSCEEFNYKEIARNPDDYIGKKFKVTVQVYSKPEGGLITESYMKAYTDDGSGYYFDKMIYLFDDQDTESDDYVNILVDDIITVYGTFEGMEESTNMLNGEKSKDIALHIKYAELVSEGE